MPQSKQWIKLYVELNHDPKIARLTWAQRGIWSALLALAGEFNDRDEDELETGRLDTLPNVAWHIRCDEGELREAVGAMIGLGMVEALSEGPDEVLFLVNYGRRQATPDSAKPSAVTERVKRHRNARRARRNDSVTTLQADVTTREEEGDKDTDLEVDEEQTAQSGAPAPPLSSSLSSSGDLSLEDLVVEVFGGIRQTDRGRIKAFVEAYGEDEVRFALDEADAQSKPTWPYIRGILENRRIERQDLDDLRQEDPDPLPGVPARASPACEFDWAAVRERVSSGELFLDGSYPVTRDDKTLVVAVSNAYAKDWLENRLYADLQRAASDVAGQKLALRFIIGQNGNGHMARV